MYVTRIEVSKGGGDGESGPENPAFHSALGLKDEGPGGRFCYVFQVTFHLTGISSDDIILRRRAVRKSYYTGTTPAHEVLASFDARALRTLHSRGSANPPDEKLIKRDARRVIIHDEPGPSLPVHLAALYPIAFEGRFTLTAENTARDILAAVDYYIRLRKRGIGGALEGDFEVLRTKVASPPPPLPPSSRTAITPWMRNWEFCRKYDCLEPGKLPLRMDRFYLRSWLVQYLSDSGKISQMRHLLRQECAGLELFHYSDDAVIDQVAELLWHGRVHLHRGLSTYSLSPDLRGQPSSPNASAPAAEPAPFPLSERKPRSAPMSPAEFHSAPQPDAATFPPSVDVARQVAALAAAAASAAPCVLL